MNAITTNQSTLCSIQVGKTFPIKIQNSPGICYEMRTGMHQLLFIEENINEAAVLEFRKEKLRFGLLSYRDVIFVTARCGTLTGDAPFSWHLLPEDARIPLPALATPESRYILPMHLIEAHSSIVKAMRQVTLSPQFSRELRATIDTQAKRPWIGGKAYDRQITSAYQLWTNHNKMMSACTCRCVGGE